MANAGSRTAEAPKKRRIQDMLLVGYGLFVMVIILAAVAQMLATNQIVGRINTQLEADAPAHELLLNIDRDSYQAQLAAEQMASSPDDADLRGLLDDFTSNRDQTQTRWDSYTDVARGLVDEEDRWPAYVEARQAWVDSTEEIVALVQAGQRSDDPGMSDLLLESRALHDGLRNVLDGIVEEIYVPNLETLDRRLTIGVWISRGLVILTIVAGLLLAYLVARQMSGKLTAALNRVGAAADQLAEGRTDVPLETEELQELDELAQAFVTIRRSQAGAAQYAQRLASGDLSETFQPRSERDDLGLALAHLQRELTEIVAGTRSAAGEVTRQVGQLQQVTADGGLEMGDDSSAVLSQALNSAVRMVDEARSGVSALTDTTTAMNGVKQAISETDEIVGELVRHSSDVSEAVSFIRTVADQTNLLALNASIEAARAGDAGKGFAVVANEVKGLAEEAATSTDRVADVVAAMVASVDQLTESMAAGRDRVTTGTGIIDGAASSFETISRGVDEVRSQIEDATLSGRDIADALTGAERRLDQAIGRFALSAAETSESNDDVVSG